jgi:purine-cytosine permease-like protein
MHVLKCSNEGLIGYWSFAYVAIVLVEHFIFRRGRFDSYNVEDWDQPSRLPLGIAATLAFLCAFGIIIPCMSQAFYQGPIAKAGTGDIGVYTGAAMAIIVYSALRTIEKKLTRKVKA